jgi:hypothetical protein
MHSQVQPCEPGPRLLGIKRRFARRADAPRMQSRSAPTRCQRLWANQRSHPLDPGWPPEESYRDYMFRRSIWP